MQVSRAHVLDEVPPRGERLAADQELRLAVGEDPFHESVVVVLDVTGLVRRTTLGRVAHRRRPAYESAKILGGVDRSWLERLVPAECFRRM